VSAGPEENRMLITGMHTVRDIFCEACHEPLGWTYVKAYEASQKYKEGLFIIERVKMEHRTRPSVMQLLKDPTNSPSSSSSQILTMPASSQLAVDHQMAGVQDINDINPLSLLDPQLSWLSSETTDN
jgi:hypothetical protein